jgi:maleamate amidohydrolase
MRSDRGRSIDQWAGDARNLPSLGIGERIGYGSSPAIVVVDMTRAFTDPSYGVGSDQADTVDATARVLAARERGDMPVFFTTMACEADEPDAGICRRKVPALLDVREEDAAVQIDERIAEAENDLVINKKFALAFFGTALAPLLASRGIDTVILTGRSTSGRVRATAVSYGYRLIVPQGCVADRAPGPHHANLFDTQAKYGDVVNVPEVLEYLRKGSMEEAAE